MTISPDRPIYRRFQIATMAPGLMQPSIVIATHRAGELGILDFEYVDDDEAVLKATRRLNNRLHGNFGVKLGGDRPELLTRIMDEFPEYLRLIIFASRHPQELQEQVRVLHDKNVTVLLDVTSPEHARSGEAVGVDGLVAKGHEAGGRVADETTFILLQRLLAEVGVPVWAHGGIGLHTAASCAAAGTAGIILDAQLALTRESPLQELVKERIASMDGSETICLGEQIGEAYRI